MSKFQIKGRFGYEVKFEYELSADDAKKPYQLRLGLAAIKAVEAGNNLRCANLEEAYLVGANLAWADLQGAYLTNACLRSSCLQYANLSGAKLVCADLEDANLTNTNFENADLRGVNLNGAKLVNTNFAGAEFCHSTWLQNREVLLAIVASNWHNCDANSQKLSPGGYMRWLGNFQKELAATEIERLRTERPGKTIVESYPAPKGEANAEQLLKLGLVGIYQYTLATKIIRFVRKLVS
jgi:hypothetical protein